MRVSEYIDGAVDLLPKHNISVFVVGPPGIGKTYGFQQACARANMDCLVVSAPMEDPSTVRGYPWRNPEGKAEHLLFDAFDRAMTCKRPTGFLIDDLPMASEATVKSMLRFIQSRELNGQRAPDHLSIWGAGNDIQHGAGVLGMIEPMKSRFHTFIEVEVNLEDIVCYGYSHGWPYELCAYLRSQPKMLMDWKPEKSLKPGGSCPRGWDHVADLWHVNKRSVSWLKGSVGEPAACGFTEFVKRHASLPDPASILLDPDHAMVPEDPSAQYFVCCAMSAMLTADTWPQIITYLNRFDQTFRAFTLLDAFSAENKKAEMGKLPKGHRFLHESAEFQAWAVSKDGIEIMQARFNKN